MHEFSQQSKLVSDSILRSPTAARNGFSQLIKGAKVMLHQNVLLTSRITELEQQIEILTKRKTRKRKRIQHSGTMDYGTASAQVAAEGSSLSKRAKKQRPLGSDELAHSALRHYSKCGGTGHNSRTCQVDEESSSESDKSTIYIGSLFDSDEDGVE
jgi:hypothetical protein